MDSRFNLAWLLLFATITVVRKVHERRAGPLRSLSGIPALEMTLMGVWALLAGVAPFFFIFGDRLALADYPFEVPGLVGLAGIGLFLVAVWLVHAAHRDLGTSWTPTALPSETGTLVTTGIYAKLRHPMYAGHIAWAVAQALMLPNFIAGLGGSVPLALLLWFRIPREERELMRVFGEDYRVYMARTGRFCPSFSSEESAHPG